MAIAEAKFAKWKGKPLPKLKLKWRLVYDHPSSRLFGKEYQAICGETVVRVLQHRSEKRHDGSINAETWTYGVNGKSYGACSGQTKIHAQALAEDHLITKIIQPGLKLVRSVGRDV